MARYTLLQIAASCGLHVSTTCRQIKQLKKEKKFVKKVPGIKYSPGEVRELEKLLDFKFSPE